MEEGKKYLKEIIDILPKNPDGSITAYRIGNIGGDGPQSYTLSEGMARTFSHQGTDIPLPGQPGLPKGGYKEFGQLSAEMVKIDPKGIKAWIPYDSEILVEPKYVTTKSQLIDIWNKANKGLPIKKTNPTVGKTIKKLTSTQLDDIVSQINSGGVTYDLAKKQGLGGQPYYAVSVYPERSKLFNGKIKKKDILQYVKDNLDLLSKKNHTLGGWYDTESKQLYLDVASAITDKNKAIDLGKKYNQKKIFDLLNFKEIDTGGTGENIKDFGDIIERIKLIESL